MRRSSRTSNNWYPGKPQRPKDRPLRPEEIPACRETLASYAQAKLEYEYFGLTRNADECQEMIDYYNTKIVAALKKAPISESLFYLNSG